ncbi:hypothetical protein [Bacillus seohaeanensis]|jgi:signal-transduction protein with cAMP-binding, CBS, and nucleotidyltransferase domain|uniref:Cyclic nucleotide-binding domain-containing protein n=1 Tax=Bacillus seohaeanensis TaxID=284580 RepID=A0ABW5RP01_9BACI
MNSYDYIFQLKRLSLFEDLRLDIVAQLTKKGNLLKVNHDEELRDILLPESIFIMLKGKVELLDVQKSHNSWVVAQWSEGEVIPNYHKNETFSRIFKTKAVDDSILLQLPIHLFLSIASQHSHTHILLLKLMHLNLTFSYGVLSTYSHRLQKNNEECDIHQQNEG